MNESVYVPTVKAIKPDDHLMIHKDTIRARMPNVGDHLIRTPWIDRHVPKEFRVKPIDCTVMLLFIILVAIAIGLGVLIKITWDADYCVTC